VPWELEGSFPLGVSEDTDYPVCSRSLGKGDILVYYSDGLIEGANAALEIYGFERLEAAITQYAHLRASDIEEVILTDFLAHCQQHEQEDDVTLVVVKIDD
jgi:serine phosphatase RsbU (regulator of sigma subunit)